MQKVQIYFSNLLIIIFKLLSNTSSICMYGEPDYPEELLK